MHACLHGNRRPILLNMSVLNTNNLPIYIQNSKLYIEWLGCWMVGMVGLWYGWVYEDTW